MGIDYITVENDGQEIVSTNYWQTENATRGYCYITTNAGAIRLLLPSVRKVWLDDMRTAKEVVISRGPWPDAGKQDAVEILFDDHTENPFAINTSIEQWERIPPDNEQGWKGVFHVYIEISPIPILAFDRVFYRRVRKIPWLKPANQ
jgi:hypothetical protein